MSRVLLNLANLKNGGGIQVGASFLDELARLKTEGNYAWLHGEVVVLASHHVMNNISAATKAALPITEIDKTINLGQLREKHDVSFTVFGPEYVPFRAAHRFVGFADVTSLWPEFARNTSRLAALKNLMRRTASRISTRGRRLVVEAPHMRAALHNMWDIKEDDVAVVPNTYNQIFDRPALWSPAPIPKNLAEPLVCFVTRLYPHKNHAVLGKVGAEMKRRGSPVKFLLTLREDEWLLLPPDVREHSVTVGSVTVDQLASIYAASAAAVFPSLLEAFSATPLEALITGTPLVASDRHFVRDVTGDFAWYADPTDPVALADALTQALSPAGADLAARGVEHARNHPTARDRAVAYADMIADALSS
ncbi:glycosyltransferase family 4 protein [Nocardioides yefusunii]|uniref:Glycosyltransferase family 4 protein n=1 Tax=Nocardioides yefusunii TaxID=2500546 RepID=A0ABW1QYH9_9ACTN|nr:glycosyltransferase family 4 protein [Nocardioides yefusunii]